MWPIADVRDSFARSEEKFERGISRGGDKEKIHAIDRKYLCIRGQTAARETETPCARARGTESTRRGEREREGGKVGCVRMRAAEGEVAGEGERTRGMQGSSVRGSVVAMGIGGEGYGGTRKGGSVDANAP